MTKYISIILVIFLFACENKKQQETFLPPDSKDVNDVIEAIIYRNSISSLKKDEKSDTAMLKDESKFVSSYPISIDLRKLKIMNFNDSSVLIPNDGSVGIGEIINSFNDQIFFSKKDSLYLLFQNEIISQFRIDKKLADKIATTTTLEQDKKRKLHLRISYIDLTIPIFSLDNNKAYVVLTHNCTGLCGGATAIYLEKINHKWIVVTEEELWVS